MHGNSAVKYLSAISLNERIKYVKLLFRWQGSVWSLLWADFLWFILLYIAVTLLYRLYLINDFNNRNRFETIVSYMNKVGGLVPLSFLLGFFVSTVLGRWWNLITSIPWMTKPSFACQAMITGGDRNIRRTIRTTFIRYINLAWILSLMQLSHKVKKRFFISNPSSYKSLLHKKEQAMHVSVRKRFEKINADKVIQKYFGEIITEEEIQVFEEFEKASVEPYKPPNIVPLMWAVRLLEKALKEGYIISENLYLNLYNIVLDFRGGLGSLSTFNDFNVPLVYTQVIIIVVYIFLISEIFSQQMIINSGLPLNNTNPLVNFQAINWQDCFPIFTIFKFLIYMGWFKVGLSLMNPLGRDAIDLPLDHILDYNLQVSSTIAPADDFFYPGYLSDDPEGNDSDRLKQLMRFDYFPSTVMQLLHKSEKETSINQSPENVKVVRDDDKLIVNMILNNSPQVSFSNK